MLGVRLDSMILKVFSNLNDSMILRPEEESAAQFGCLSVTCPSSLQSTRAAKVFLFKAVLVLCCRSSPGFVSITVVKCQYIPDLTDE